jgi:hypothetical protein
MQILGMTAQYHKLVYEVRYDYGYVYLDRCGTTTTRIIREHPEWLVNPQNINPQQAPLVHALAGINFNFGPVKYDFSLDQRINSAISKADVDQFIREAENLSAIVNEELELSNFTREGFRVWYTFPMKSEDDSREWISGLNSVSINNKMTDAFAGKLVSFNYVIAIEGDERRFRIAVNGVERTEALDVGNERLKTLPRNLPKGQRAHLIEQLKEKRRLLVSPEAAVMIDVDAVVENPVEIAPSDFITESLKLIENALPALAGGGL